MKSRPIPFSVVLRWTLLFFLCLLLNDYGIAGTITPDLVLEPFGGPTANCPDLLPGQFGDDDGNCTEGVNIPFTIGSDCELLDQSDNFNGTILSAELDAFAVDVDQDGAISPEEFTAETGSAGNVLSNINDDGSGNFEFVGIYPIIPPNEDDNVFHAVRLTFADECGTEATAIFVFHVIDCKRPVPICINGLTVTLEPQPDGTCAAVVTAAEMIAEPQGDCTGQGPETDEDGDLLVTTCAIYLAHTIEAVPNFIPDATDTEIILTEDDDETTVLYVFCFDNAGNYDFCETYVLVQSSAACSLLPGIDCPAPTGQAIVTKNVQTLQGLLTAADTPLVMTDHSCYVNTIDPEAGAQRLDVRSFTPSVDGYYTFYLGAEFAATLTLYSDEFSEDNPCRKYLGGVNNAYGFPLPDDPELLDEYLGFYLEAGETYGLAVANQSPGTFGNWEITAYHDGGSGTLSGFGAVTPGTIQLNLLCTDTETIRFEAPQQWVVNPNGAINNDLTRDQFFGGSQDSLDAFLLQLNYTGAPLVTDDCGLVLVTLTDELTTNGDCGDPTIERTFATEPYTDDCDTPAMTCSQTITFTMPTLDAVAVLPYTGSVDCDEDFTTDGPTGGPDDNPAASETGLPVILTLTGYQPLDQTFCNLGAIYSDEPRIDICTGIYAFRREWNLINWCNPAENRLHDQYVRVGDEEGPIFVNVPDTIQIGTTPFDCLTTFTVPIPEVVDGNGCSSAAPTVFEILSEDGTLYAVGSPGATVILEDGKYNLLLYAEDDCGNETSAEVCLIVMDDSSPVAVCVEELTIQIGGGDVLSGIEGIARIFPEDIDDGSFDNCGAVTLEVRRNFWRNNTCDPSPNRYSAWGPHADFYCCDIDNEIRLELRVTDEAGLQTVCFVIVTVEDLLVPFCFAQNDVSFACNAEPDGFPDDLEAAYADDFSATSELLNELLNGPFNSGPSGTDNCAVDTLVERPPLFDLNECGIGTVTRRFEAWQLRPEGDVNGNGAIDIDEVFRSENSCTQIVTITAAHDFTIDFPEDASVDCAMPDVPGVIVTESDCDVLAINVSEPAPLAATGEECYQLAVTYDVINWCLWDGEYTGYEVPRRTEEDGEPVATGFTVEAAERPILHLTTEIGPDDENCDGILSTEENQADDADDLRFFLTIDRTHPADEGDSSLADENFDNVAETPADCLLADAANIRNYGRYRYTQILQVTGAGALALEVADFGGPILEAPDLENGQFADVDGDCLGAVSIPFSFVGDCPLLDGIDIAAGGTVTAQLDEFAVDTDLNGEIDADEFVSDAEVSGAIGTDADGNFVYTGELPIIPSPEENIRHALRVIFSDNCGNTATGVITFTVVDRFIAPPICVPSLNLTLVPQADGNCGLTINAEDLVAAPSYDCTGQGPEVDADGNAILQTYAIYRAIEVETDPDFVPDATHTTIDLNEDDDVSTVIYLYVFDEEGNYALCESVIFIEYSTECNRTVQGTIRTTADEPVEDVEVVLTGSAEGVDLTGPDGAYLLNFYVNGPENYTVTPSKDTDHGNGINTIDMIILLRHTLGLELITDPFLLIAADVDNSGTVTGDDFDLIRQLILENITEFPNNSSWRFVDADYVFPEPTNPWAEPFPETIVLEDVMEDVLDADFIGIKIGDLDGTAENFLRPTAEVRKRETQYLYTAEQTLQAGSIYRLPITAGQWSELTGLQGTFELHDLELIDIDYGVLKADNFGLSRTGEGYLTMSWWRDANGAARNQADVLCYLIVRARRTALLSSLLEINSRITRAESYRTDTGAIQGIQTLDLQLAFAGKEEREAAIVLAQNVPNPFTDETVINYYLPVMEEEQPSESVMLEVRDLKGRLLQRMKAPYRSGYQTFRLTREMLNGARGVLTYTLRVGEREITRKMIVLN